MRRWQTCANASRRRGGPTAKPVADPSQGVQLQKLQALARYWSDRLRLAQGRGEAQRAAAVHDDDRRRRHSLHPRPLEHPNALPLIITHGWPGSVIEQLKIIGPLTDPTGHGGSAEDAFDVVIPSLPGYGFLRQSRPALVGTPTASHEPGRS
jgi:hypothetical protein